MVPRLGSIQFHYRVGPSHCVSVASAETTGVYRAIVGIVALAGGGVGATVANFAPGIAVVSLVAYGILGGIGLAAICLCIQFAMSEGVKVGASLRARVAMTGVLFGITEGLLLVFWGTPTLLVKCATAAVDCVATGQSRSASAEVLFLCLLRILPSDLRAEFGEEMALHFCAAWRKCEFGRWSWLAREMAALVVVAVNERARHRDGH